MYVFILRHIFTSSPVLRLRLFSHQIHDIYLSYATTSAPTRFSTLAGRPHKRNARAARKSCIFETGWPGLNMFDHIMIGKTIRS